MKANKKDSVENNLDDLRSIFLKSIIGSFDENSLTKIRRALELAEDAHNGQIRDDNTPYILHPLRIVLTLIHELNVYDAELLCVALLHDVAEDNKKYSYKNIRNEFGDRIGSIVHTLTKPNRWWRTREEVNKIYFERLLNSDDDCKLIKLLDKLDNVRDAVNSSNLKKQKRTASEAKNFFVEKLLVSLTENRQKQILGILFDDAIDVLNRGIAE